MLIETFAARATSRMVTLVWRSSESDPTTLRRRLVRALVNEPEASDCLPGYAGDCSSHIQCPNPASATAALRSFVDVVGGEIKRIDPNHLVESGALGGTQCGWAGSSFSSAVKSATASAWRPSSKNVSAR